MISHLIIESLIINYFFYFTITLYYSPRFWSGQTWNNFFPKILIFIKGLNIKWMVLTKKYSRFSDTVSHEIDSIAFDFHRDYPPVRELMIDAYDFCKDFHYIIRFTCYKILLKPRRCFSWTRSEKYQGQ